MCSSISCSDKHDYTYTQELEIKQMLSDFESNVRNREVSETIVSSIKFSSGSFSISTSEPQKQADGQRLYSSPSKETGFYVSPRGVWVESLEEAKRIILEDYRSNNKR